MNMIPGKQCMRVITTVILFLQEEIKTQAVASSIVTIDITRSWQIRQRFRFGQKRDNLTTGIQEYYYENRYYIRHTQQHLRF